MTMTMMHMLTLCFMICCSKTASVLGETVEKNDKKIRGSAEITTTTDRRSTRNLAYARNKINWSECVDNELTAKECKALAENEITRGHLLDNIRIVIKYPAGNGTDAHEDTVYEDEPGFLGDELTPDEEEKIEHEKEDMYHRVKIPVNYMAQVVSHHPFGEAVVTYGPKVWDGVGSGPRYIGPWNCRGMNANQCCTMIKQDVRDRDVNGHHLDCYVEEEEPIPFHKGNRIAYCSWEYKEASDEYVPAMVAEWRLEKVLNFAKNKLKTIVLPTVEECLLHGMCTYNALDLIENNLHFHGRSQTAFQHSCSLIDAYLHPPYTEDTIFYIDAGAGSGLREILEELYNELEKFLNAPFEIQHTLTIEAGDAEGTHVKVPPMINASKRKTAPPCLPTF